MGLPKRNFSSILDGYQQRTALEVIIKNADFFLEEVKKIPELERYNENKIELLLKSFYEYIKAIDLGFIPAYDLISDSLDLLHSCRDIFDRSTYARKDDRIKLFYLENGAVKGDLYCIKKLISYYFSEYNVFSDSNKAKKYLFKLLDDYNQNKIEKHLFNEIVGTVLINYLLFCVLNLEPIKFLDIIAIYKKNIQESYIIEYEDFQASAKDSKIYLASISEEELEYDPTYQINNVMNKAFKIINNILVSGDFALHLESFSVKTEYLSSHFIRSKIFWRNLGYYDFSIMDQEKSKFLVTWNDYTYDSDKQELRELIKIGSNFELGTNNIIPDPSKAIEIYKKTLKYNHLDSYRKIGTTYLFGEFSPNARTDKENKQFTREAYNYFRDGANLGDNLCYILLAKIYFDQQGEYFNIRQGVACLDVFFEKFDRNFLEINNYEIFEYEMRIVDVLGDYLEYCAKNNIEPLFQKYFQLFHVHINENLNAIINFLHIRKKDAEKNKEDIMTLALENMISYNKFLKRMVESNDYRKHLNKKTFHETVKKLNLQYLVDHI